MSNQGDFNEQDTRRTYVAPYTSRHPIPTVQKYRAERDEREQRQEKTEAAQEDEQDESNVKRAFHSAKAILKGEEEPKSTHEVYPTENRNKEGAGESQQPRDDTSNQAKQENSTQIPKSKSSVDKNGKQEKSATEAVASQSDPRQKRKNMKNMKRDDGGREVTDPVTHLPVVIRDSTTKDLTSAPENEPASGSIPKTMTGLSGATKERSQLDREQKELQQSQMGMQKLFPPPSFDDTKAELIKTYQLALTGGLGAVVLLSTVVLLFIQIFDIRVSRKSTASGGKWYEGLQWSLLPLVGIMSITATAGFAIVTAFRGWLGKKVEEVWEDEVWDAARQQEIESHDGEAMLPESVAWLNSILASVWPLINPDLFTSIADMLEDVMQASLPKIVRMVSVDDLGQGSEAVRILGIKWLPTGAASQSVDDDGNLKTAEEDQGESDRTAPGEGQEESAAKDEDDEKQTQESKEEKQKQLQKEQEQQAIREGMEAEQGDFVNLELAFAYRARSSGKSIKTKAKNAHLYLRFYLPGGVAVPVWVELRGIIGKMRLRLQLAPDPPFFSLCTLTFMGQPQADLSCVPLSKHSLNLMDVPLISSFVQSSIDAALAEYVAPKSLTLDLKDMLVGDDFKKDTVARGVVMIYIKRAREFKEGDGGIGPIKDGGSDSYVTVSWGKFGKPVASTRIIVDDQKPNWNEWSEILVTPEELNASENLRLQLWDSDKYTADDDLGRVEVDLKELMHSPKTRNKMCDREDRFVGQDPDEKMPGTLTWSVGYFEKLRITEDQLAKQTEDPKIKTKEDLKKQVGEAAERKLREATEHDESKEIKQQKQQDYKEREDALIISAPPPDEYSSGVFSIQIHNITGLEIQQLQKRSEDGGNREDEADMNEDLPSSYANIILNHQTIYRTRTKPKNAKPFFNACTERFVRDWRTTEVMISVRDDRERENDALLGMVYLPLRKVFHERSQIMDSYPLVGGIGFGRMRVSMVWRSMEVKLPKELLGWNYGTLEVKDPIKWKTGDNHGKEVHGHRIKLRTNLMTAKLDNKDDDQWVSKRNGESVYLAVRKRYSSALVVDFRKSTLGSDSTPAFGVFWLSQVADEEEKTITVQVWKGGKEAEKRATSCCDYKGLEENETPLGELEVTVKFWRGLSGYHKKFANKANNADVRNVMEVLDTANDEKEMGGEEDSGTTDSDDTDSGAENNTDPGTATTKKKLRTHANQDSSDSEMDGKDGTETKNPFKKAKDKIENAVDGHNDADDGSRGVMAQMRDYKDHHKQLHRQHRGVMQWKGARTLDWMAGKFRRGTDRIEGVFEHGEKDTGVETEV